MPVLLPILEYAPANTYLIATDEVRDVAEAVRQVARQRQLRVSILESVDPYAPEQTLRRCREVIARLPAGQAAAVNLSGGTTLMAMGAQHAARELGLPMLYVNTDCGEIIHMAAEGAELRRDPIASKVSVALYAAAHGAASGVKDHWSTGWDGAAGWSQGLALAEPYLGAARALGRAGSAGAPLLATIRSNIEGVFSFADVSRAQEGLLGVLADAGFIVPDGAASGAYRIGAAHPHTRQFLEGHWLEIFAADACAQSGWFDDVRCSVKLRRDEGQRPVVNELDVIVTSQGRLAAISCKTGRELAEGGKGDSDKRKLAIFELDALLQADLMGLYARKALVTNQPAINQDLRNRAYYGQICCVTGPRLGEVARIVRNHLDTPQLTI